MDKQDLIRDIESAMAALRRMPTGKAAFGAEARLGEAYQRAVQAGIVPRLKGKYRG